MGRLDEDVLARIESEGLRPRPVILFLGRQAVFWCLSALSIVLGALSFAVLIFIALDFARTGGREFDEMPFDDAAIVLLAIWGLCTVLFAASAWFGVRKTRRGYRHRPPLIFAAAAAISLALGGVLYGFDVGRNVHEFLVRQFPAYAGYTAIPYAEWSRPDQGYLGGEVLSMDGPSFRLRAFDGAEWMVDMEGAKISTDGTPLEEGDVAIRGTRTAPHGFKATSVAPFD